MKMEKQLRLDKYLGDNRCGTRSELKKLIRAGSVTINGICCKDPAQKITPDSDQVCFQRKLLSYEPFQYFVFHKPAGCISATKDAKQKTVMDYFPDTLHKDLAPVGRLDIDTEGLLLVTDDGALAHDLLSPAKHVEKTYYAKLDKKVPPDAAALFLEGLDIGEKKKTKPGRLQVLHNTSDLVDVEITISEGKFHQVKRMCQKIGCEVLYLKRIRFGTLTLDENLEKGTYRSLTKEELSQLRGE